MSRPIINKPIIPVINTHEYKYPAGKINPVEKRINTKNLCIDSLFRKNYDKTKCNNFTFFLPEVINNVISLNVSAVEFPNCWYTFDSRNKSNEFTITLYNTPSPSDTAEVYPAKITHVIQIPSGNYRSDLFSMSMNNMFSNLRNGLEFLYFDVNELTSKCVIRSKSSGDDTKSLFMNSDILWGYTRKENGIAVLDDNDIPILDIPTNVFYFTLNFAVDSDPERPLYLNAGWMMGFRKSYYVVNYSDTPYSDIITGNFTSGTLSSKDYNWYIDGESSYGSNIQNYIYLEIDDYHKNFVTNTIVCNSIHENYLGNNIMGRISVVSGMNTIITNTASDCVFKKREYFGPVKLEKMNIRLLNRFGEPIIMNDNDFSFTLEIEQLYS